MKPDNIFHQQILKQFAAGVSGIIHLTDRERDTLGKGAACLICTTDEQQNNARTATPPYLPLNITVL